MPDSGGVTVFSPGKRVRMSGLSKYLFETRTAASSGRGQVPGANATLLTIPSALDEPPYSATADLDRERLLHHEGA